VTACCDCMLRLLRCDIGVDRSVRWGRLDIYSISTFHYDWMRVVEFHSRLQLVTTAEMAANAASYKGEEIGKDRQRIRYSISIIS
jgi:hypothetical protein